MSQMDLLDLLDVLDPAAPAVSNAAIVYARSIVPVDSMLRRETNPLGLVAWQVLLPGGDLKTMFRRPDQPLNEEDVRLDTCPRERTCRSAGWTRPVGADPVEFSCGYCGLRPADGIQVAPIEQTLDEIKVNVVATFLGPHGLNRVIRALGTKWLDDVRRDLGDGGGGQGAPGYALDRLPTGIGVRQWFGVEPFRLTWNQVFRIVRSHTTPELAAALHAVCDGVAGGCTPDQWAAADAILPRRKDTFR